MADSTDAELIHRTRAGEHEAYKWLVGRYEGHVYGLAYSLVGNWAEAQDIAQETFIRAYVNLDRLRDPARFAAWLRRVTFGVAMNWLRAFRPGLFEQLDGRVDPDHLELPDFRPGPPEIAEKRELGDAVLAAVAQLPLKYRVPLTMFHLDGLSYKKVADFLDISLGTAKSMIQRAREKLRAIVPAAIAKEMTPMVQEVFNEHRPPEEFASEVLKRIGHWERFGPPEGWPAAKEQRVDTVMADPEWARLTEIEIGLEPMSDPCRRIRKQIASLERCHEHYVENIEEVLRMIGSMKPGRVLDCGGACKPRREQAAAYAHALQSWLELDRLPANADEHASEVFELLGDKTGQKPRLIEHLLGKLRDNSYRVYADAQEDFDTVESRVQHLEICNYNWRENLRIVLKEIAAGRRLFDWHVPDGYNAHGDCPNRVRELQDLMASAAAWADGNVTKAGKSGEALGRTTPERRWLVACLCKHVAAQHKDHDSETLLARPGL